jgi:hypothetical protein
VASFGGLPPSITPAVCQRLVAAVRQAYHANVALWSSAIGHDSQTYGQMLYKSIWHFLEQELFGMPGVTCHRTPMSFEVHIGPVVIKSYKLGRSEEDDLDQRFPSNPFATQVMALENLEQLQLFDQEPMPTHFVLGHQGNPVTGAQTVYLLAPLVNGTGYEWALRVRIDQPPAQQPPAPPLPAPVPIAPAPLRPRARPEREVQ